VPPSPPGRACADLTIEPSARPIPDVAGDFTVVPVVVANVGSAAAPATQARVEDPNRTDGDPRRIAEADVPPLGPGQQVRLELRLQYLITGSTNLAALLLVVDPKDLIPECREDNNRRTVGPP